MRRKKTETAEFIIEKSVDRFNCEVKLGDLVLYATPNTNFNFGRINKINESGKIYIKDIITCGQCQRLSHQIMFIPNEKMMILLTEIG